MDSTPATKKLAKKIYRYIKENPERHFQGNWVEPPNDDIEQLADDNMCSTTLCVAGAAVYFTKGIEGLKYHWHNGNWKEAGMDALGLTDDEAEVLFHNTDDESALEAVKALGSGDEVAFEEIIEEFNY